MVIFWLVCRIMIFDTWKLRKLGAVRPIPKADSPNLGETKRAVDAGVLGGAFPPGSTPTTSYSAATMVHTALPKALMPNSQQMTSDSFPFMATAGQISSSPHSIHLPRKYYLHSGQLRRTISPAEPTVYPLNNRPHNP